MPDGQTLKDRATQLLTKYKSGALVTQIGYTRRRLWAMIENLSSSDHVHKHCTNRLNTFLLFCQGREVHFVEEM